MYLLLTDRQFGFRSGRGTTDAILDHLSYIYSNLDKDDYIFTAFLDFRKAFDCVNHDILISKLDHYGVRGVCLKWFRSYLSGRSQYVFVNGVSSSVANVNCGVPQGSILGPLLYLCFVNDIVNSCGDLRYTLYADDTTLSRSFQRSKLRSVTDSINTDLSSVKLWINSNRLCLNSDKTKYMIFSCTGRVELDGVLIGDDAIAGTDSYKFLGLNIDNNIRFKNHISTISSRISKSIGVLNKLKEFLPHSVLLSLYFTLIHPYFLYAIEAYFSTASCHTNSLGVLQRRAIRTIFNLDAHAVIEPSLLQSSILRLDDLFLYRTCLLVHRAVLNLNVPDFLSVITRQADLHDYSTRNRSNIVLPYFTKTKSQYSIQYNGINMYNGLPENIKQSPTVSEFKRHLLNHLIGGYDY